MFALPTPSLCAIMASLCLSGWVCARLSPSDFHSEGSACFSAVPGQAWSAFPSPKRLLGGLVSSDVVLFGFAV